MNDRNIKKEKAVFLDRDGTLNADSVDYIKSVDEFQVFDFTADALSVFTKLGYLNIIVTNQSAVGRGMITIDILDKMFKKLSNLVESAGAEINGVYYCPHLPEDNCNCRKPKTGNLEKAIEDFQIDVSRSFFIGDSYKDIQTGAAAGCRTIFVRTGVDSPSIKVINNWNPRPTFIAENLLEAAQLIECMERNNKS